MGPSCKVPYLGARPRGQARGVFIGFFWCAVHCVFLHFTFYIAADHQGAYYARDESGGGTHGSSSPRRTPPAGAPGVTIELGLGRLEG
eukprot:scaffold59422_cov57-Phaeocystis_antarctica.AAC.4